MRIHTAEVIATGSELLQGRTLNLHGFTFGALLTEFGVALSRETVLPDSFEMIRDTTREALARSELVILTGGLGPTDDDRTLEAVAAALELPIVSHAAADAHLDTYFSRMNRIPTPAQRRQARILGGAEAFLNPVGIAPGQKLTTPNGRTLWLLPGPPRELNGLIRTALRPWLSSTLSHPDRQMVHFLLLGHSESRVQETLSQWALPYTLETAYCARPGSVELRFTGPRLDIAPVVHQVRLHYQHDLLNETGAPVEEEVLALLRERTETLATAESCTAGGIAERLTSVPGSSDVVRGGVIAYANDVKTALLGVEVDMLARFGAVSEPVAGRMAIGAREITGADWGVSITGIAGPGGGTPDKPVGLLCVGISSPHATRTHRFQVNGDRGQIREHGIQRALEMLWRSAKQPPIET